MLVCERYACCIALTARGGSISLERVVAAGAAVAPAMVAVVSVVLEVVVVGAGERARARTAPAAPVPTALLSLRMSGDPTGRPGFATCPPTYVYCVRSPVRRAPGAETQSWCTAAERMPVLCPHRPSDGPSTGGLAVRALFSFSRNFFLRGVVSPDSWVQLL